MATAGTQEIILITPGKLVGPGTPFEQRRIELQQEVAIVLRDSKKITVNSVESSEQATAAGRVLQTAQKERENFFKGIKGQIDLVKAPVLAAEKEDIGPIEAEKQRLGAEITKFNNAQRVLREAQERAAREAAEQAAREELLNRAIELEASGEAEQADQVLAEPVFVPVIIQSSVAPKVQGQVGKFTYGAEVTDLMALVKAVAAGTVPLQAIKADESYIGGLARVQKEGFCLAGCKLVKKESTHFRS